jgi:hypothetical protein
MANYDYPNAMSMGVQANAPSLDPVTGMVLKDPGHSTFWKTQQKEASLGNAPLGGRQYSFPTQYQYLSGQALNNNMSDSNFLKALAQARAMKRRKSVLDLLKKRKTAEQMLAKELPRLKDMQEQMKIRDAESKLKRLQLDRLTKQAEMYAGQQQQGPGIPQ